MISIRFFWLLVFVFFVGLSSYLLEDLLTPPISFKVGSLEDKIHNDFVNLEKSKSLPTHFRNLNRFKIKDHRTHQPQISWEKIAPIHFPSNPLGTLELQIEIFDSRASDSADKSKSADLVFIQFSLFEIKTENKVWELTRSYYQFQNL